MWEHSAPPRTLLTKSRFYFHVLLFYILICCRKLFHFALQSLHSPITVTGLRRSSAAAWLLGSGVRIPLRSCMLVCCVCCVGSGLFYELITRSWESYRVYIYLILWHIVTSQKKKKPRPELDCVATEKRDVLHCPTWYMYAAVLGAIVLVFRWGLRSHTLTRVWSLWR